MFLCSGNCFVIVCKEKKNWNRWHTRPPLADGKDSYTFALWLLLKLERLADNAQTKPVHSNDHTEGEEYSAYLKLNTGIKMEEKRLIIK